MKVCKIIDNLLLGKDLEQPSASYLFQTILAKKPKISHSETAEALALLQKKGEVSSELYALILIARRKSKKVQINRNLNLVDGCGTGGDRKGTINISTLACLVAAGSGAQVAKHGNRSFTSQCGSSDLMSAFGVEINGNANRMLQSLKQNRIGYFHAPNFNQTFAPVQTIRRKFGFQGIRTIFNFAGPLLNPLQPKHQVVGVYEKRYIPLIAETLKKLGVAHAIVMSGKNGLDEFSTSQSSYVIELKNSKLRAYRFDPKKFHLKKASDQKLKGGSIQTNKKRALKILNNREHSGASDTILLNAAFLLYVSGRAKTIQEGLEQSRKSVSSGDALKALQGLIRVSRGA